MGATPTNCSCSFCGRKFEEVLDIRVNGTEDAFICSICIEVFHQSGAK
jgi:ClpX C4-type zinc finger protein